MADKQPSNRRAPSSRQEPSRRGSRERPDTRDRRTQMIHCDRCGEDYSATYRRCPFCDERPNGGKRQTNRRGGGYGAPVNPVQVASVVVGLVIIIAAFYILFTKVVPFFSGKDTPSDPVSPGSSTSQIDPGPSQQPSDVPSDPVPPQPPAVPVTSLTLDKTDFTLAPDEHAALKATVVPQDAGTVVWTCDRPEALYVSETGTVININSGSSKVKATVTASIGGKTATCTVYCKPGSKNAPPATPNAPAPSTPATPAPSTPTAPEPQPSAGTLAPGTEAVITGAGSGLNVRSGPSTDSEVVASIQNGNTVIIKENAGNGWYKVDYGNHKLGYISSSFVKTK